MTQMLWDVIIVGQGLAGTTLALHLQQAGQRVLVIDAQESVTSSKIAAGLITPITGQRLTLEPQCHDYLSFAREFYRSVEHSSGASFFYDRTAVRLFKSDAERRTWAQRRTQDAFQSHLLNPEPTPLLDPDLGDASGGGFAMQAAQLDVAACLEASRGLFPYESMVLNWEDDVQLGTDEISVSGHQSRYVISCEGYAAARNPYFLWIPFKAAKGDILTVWFHQSLPQNSLHRGIWIAPTSEPDVFKIGATYDRVNLDHQPSAAARKDIESKLAEFFHVPYTVLGHKAAVRPIINESKALIGLHPLHQRLGYFNGLGSKGSLHAPLLAKQFSDFLTHKEPLPEALDLRNHPAVEALRG